MGRVRWLAVLAVLILAAPWPATGVIGAAEQQAGSSAAASAEPLSPALQEGLRLIAKRQYEDAAKALKKALDKEKPTSRGYLLLAQAYAGLREYKNVLESCDKAIACAATASDKAVAHNTKGVALFLRGSEKQPPGANDLKAAAGEFSVALDVDPSLHTAHYNLGKAMLKAGNDAAGIEQLRLYLAVAPLGAAAKDAERMIANPRRARENFAPDFSVETLDGEKIDLESLRGKVVIVDFWASWCGPCLETVKYLRAIQKKYAAQPVVLLSISVDDDADAWRAAIAAGKMTWRHSMDGNGRVSKLFGVGPIPMTVVIDGEGIIRGRLVGFSDSFGFELEDAVRDGLKRLAPAGK
jgi:thiol-disulfide isomerase/thioredoxin/Tfp pilus assembly protein PilF